MIEIDGSKGEGGGQILRTSLALSVVTGKPCYIFNIREGRPNPGLAPQHLLGIKALTQFCNGKVEGDFLRSREIKFYPNQTNRERVSVEIPTAGSITLILQTLLLPALFSKKGLEVHFKGGATDTFFSPTIDYFRFVFLRILKKMFPKDFQEKIEINIIKRGYYPEGGAEVKVKILPLRGKFKALDLRKKGGLERILILSGASESLKKKKVAERQITGAKETLGKLKLPLEEKAEYYNTQCPGSNICLIANFENTVIGIDNLGKIGKKAEEIGKETALELLKEGSSGACLDRHLADQILPYIALAKRKSKIRVSQITKHCQTNMWVIEKFIEGRFKIENNLISWIEK